MSIDRYEIERSERWRDKIASIPFIKFDGEWEVKVIPPFGGAFARFLVKSGKKQISVYLDMNDSLGCVGEPYWEIYPYQDDTCRVLMNDTDDLYMFMKQALQED